MRGIIRSLTGIAMVRCGATLARAPQCFSFASGQCDRCALPLCSKHKQKRQEFYHQRMREWILCTSCVEMYDYEQS